MNSNRGIEKEDESVLENLATEDADGAVGGTTFTIVFTPPITVSVITKS